MTIALPPMRIVVNSNAPADVVFLMQNHRIVGVITNINALDYEDERNNPEWIDLGGEG